MVSSNDPHLAAILRRARTADEQYKALRAFLDLVSPFVENGGGGVDLQERIKRANVLIEKLNTTSTVVDGEVEVESSGRLARPEPKSKLVDIEFVPDVTEPVDLSAVDGYITKQTEKFDQKRLASDFAYCAESLFKIPYRPGMNPDYPHGGAGPMVLTKAQKKIVAYIVKRMLVDKKPVRAIVLKSRQLGHTTLQLALASWLMQIKSNYAVMLIIDKLDHFNDKRPIMREWFKAFQLNMAGAATLEVCNDREIRLSNGSSFTVEGGTSDNPGTSTRLDFLILSERPKWKSKAEAEVMRSLVPAIPETAGTCVIDESTANGINQFYADYGEAKRGVSKFDAIFLPWHISEEYCIQAPENFQFSDDEKFKDYDYDNGKEISEEEYAKKHNLTNGQIVWRRTKILSMKGSRDSFNTEFPTTPAHAFSATGRGFFPIKLQEHAALHESPCRTFNIIDKSNSNEACPYFGQLKPKLEEDPMGEIFIREMPKLHEEYFFGIDAAEGREAVNFSGEKEPDWTVGVMLDSRARQVAAVISRRTSDIMWLPMVLLCKLYNTAWFGGEKNQAGISYLSYLRSTNYPKIVCNMDQIAKGRTQTDSQWFQTRGSNKKPMLESLRASWTDKPDRIFSWNQAISKVHPATQIANFRHDGRGTLGASVGFDDYILGSNAAYWAFTSVRGQVQNIAEKELFKTESPPQQPAIVEKDDVAIMLEMAFKGSMPRSGGGLTFMPPSRRRIGR